MKSIKSNINKYFKLVILKKCCLKKRKFSSMVTSTLSHLPLGISLIRIVLCTHICIQVCTLERIHYIVIIINHIKTNELQ